MLTELQCYQKKINLPLLNEIVAFVLNTAEATHAQRADLYRRCPLLYPKTGCLQEKYGFLYLGELLERYEERFGMSTQDLRAITLALGFTRDFIDDTMFIGSQREDFLRKAAKASPGDIYLTGALYLLDEGRSGMVEREQALTALQYDSTEDLLFVLGLFQDHTRAFLHFKPQLLRLLGQERTVPILGNVTALNWFTTWMAPNLKACRNKDMALFRALCTLPAAHVKPDGKAYPVLQKHGYTALEIAYGNMLTVLSQTAPDVLRTESITSEKIAVSLFREVFSCEDALAPEVYEQLSWVYRIYEKFKIRCGGKERLLQMFEDGTHIRNSDTFIWFSRQADIHHPVFQGFDIMDRKWDSLPKTLESKQYRPLFEFCLREDMTSEEIRQRLDRYQALTGNDYTNIFWKDSFGDRFGLLVNKGILDLWSLFQLKLRRDFLDADGHRRLLRWLEEYVFHYNPEDYLLLITAILKDEFASGLFSPEEQRKLFDIAARNPDMPAYDRNELKRKYLTKSELQAEQEAKDAALRASEEQKRAEQVQRIRDKYDEILDGSFQSVIKFLDQYKYYREESPIACRVVREHLDGLLESRNDELDGQEAVRFLHVCNKLVHGKALCFAEAQVYITKVKEC